MACNESSDFQQATSQTLQRLVTLSMVSTLRLQFAHMNSVSRRRHSTCIQRNAYH